MAAQLNLAKLYYGSTAYDVKPNDISPLPAVFDFDKAEDCARLIFSVMSNASGGHTLHQCKLKIDRKRGRANMTANGVHVYYADPATPKFKDALEAIEAEKAAEVFELGSVTTDQYGDGWNRAVWVK